MKTKALIQVILAGILWGILNIFVKNLYAAGFEPMQIVFLRLLCASIVITIYTFVKGKHLFKIKARDIWMFVGTGVISLVLFNLCYFYSVVHGQVSVSVVLLYTSPIFVMLMSALIFKEKITYVKVVALFLTFGGCIFVSGVIGGSYSIPFIVILAGIAAGFLYALYSIFGRFAVDKYDSVTITFYTFILGLAGAVIFGKPVETLRTVAVEPKVIIFVVGLGIISTFLPYLFYTAGLKNLDPGEAAIFVAVEPLVGAVLGMTVFKESHDIIKLVGIALILTAVIILGRASVKE